MKRRCVVLSGMPVVWILLGRAGFAHAEPSDFQEDEARAVWQVSGQDGSQFGWAVSEIADLDDDGVTDALVGAPRHDAGDGAAGMLVVLSGATGEELRRFVGTPGEELGYAMADAGDVDGDGVHDIVVGAPGSEGHGRAYVYSGANGSSLLTVDGEAPVDRFGSAVSSAGDIDGDGLADLLIGAERADLDVEADDDAGRAYWVSGTDGVFVHTKDGAVAGARFGSATAMVGDVDGDDVVDGFVGARGMDGGGAAYVFSGATGAELHGLDGGEGSGAFGWFFVATPGDLDSDGVADLYVGDFSASVAGNGSGRLHVFSGDSGEPLFDRTGSGPGQGLGPGRGAGDVNGDGIPDLVVGSYSSSDGAPQSGKVTWFSGVDGTALRSVTSLEAGEQLGFDAVGLGDVDGDGHLDALAAAAGGDHVYVLAGVSLDEPPDDDGDGSAGGDSGDSNPNPTMGDGPGDDGPNQPPPADDSGMDPSTTGGAEGDSDGCGCRNSGSTQGWAWLLLAAVGIRRRRSLSSRR